MRCFRGRTNGRLSEALSEIGRWDGVGRWIWNEAHPYREGQSALFNLLNKISTVLPLGILQTIEKGDIEKTM